MTDAATLRSLHGKGSPLLLPNAWDVASALAVVAAGFPAVATSSLAVAESLGHTDGEALPVDQLFDLLAAITAAVDVPVTADVERGYGLDPAELVERLAQAGVVGCNLEDSDPRTGELVEVGRQADLLAAVRGAAVAQGWDLVLNARVDAAMSGAGLDEAITRAQAYAVADCVYPIMLEPAAGLATLVAEVALPVNALCRKGQACIAQLAALGVARVSFGPGLWRADAEARPSMLQAISAGRDPWATVD